MAIIVELNCILKREDLEEKGKKVRRATNKKREKVTY